MSSQPHQSIALAATATDTTATINDEEPHVLNKFIKRPYTVGLVPVPFSGGQPKSGVDDGPIELLRYGLLSQIKELGYKVDFEGDDIEAYTKLRPESDPDIGVLKKPLYVSRACELVKSKVAAQCMAG
ncbi:Arginase, catabolizes arginine to ornithine and urea, partial [Spiromyces aspiralis]